VGRTQKQTRVAPLEPGHKFAAAFTTSTVAGSLPRPEPKVVLAANDTPIADGEAGDLFEGGHVREAARRAPSSTGNASRLSCVSSTGDMSRRRDGRSYTMFLGANDIRSASSVGPMRVILPQPSLNW